MTITQQLQRLFSPSAESTPLDRLTLSQLREREAGFVAQGEVLDQGISESGPRVARRTAEAAIGGPGAASLDDAEDDRSRLSELRDARARIDDALAGVRDEISKRLAGERDARLAALRQAMLGAHAAWVARSTRAYDLARQLATELVAADHARAALAASLPPGDLGRMPMILQSSQWFVGLWSQRLFVLSDKRVGLAHSAKTLHEMTADQEAFPIPDQVAELAQILDAVEFESRE